MPEPLREFFESGHTSIKYAVGQIDIYGNVFHECYELYLLLQGDVEFINSHTRQNIHPGQLVIIPPGEYHQFLVHSDMQAYERCVIDVWPGLLEKSVLRDALCGKELKSVAVKRQVTCGNHYRTVISITLCYGGHKHSRCAGHTKVSYTNALLFHRITNPLGKGRS